MKNPLHTEETGMNEKAIHNKPKLVWQEARDHAKDIIQTLNLPIPVDPWKVASALSLRVQEKPLKDGVRGYISQNEGEDPIILIQATDSMSQKRYTLAHIIGHYIDRVVICGSYDYSFVDYRKQIHPDIHEYFANEFASALLMPEQEFVAAYSERRPLGVALMFDVPFVAVEKRMRRLLQTKER